MATNTVTTQDGVEIDLQGAVHTGHSTGGGEVVRHLARHGTARASRAKAHHDGVVAF